MKVLLLEINEIPHKLITKYASRFINIEKFISNSQFVETQCQDVGELSPWVTWPSFHRGMNNTEHKIKHLGQDPQTFNGTAIWEDLRQQGKTIGIFGSLQSWPPIDPGLGGFYIPDTFAHDEKTIPESFNEIQRFNLNQVKNNARVVKGQSFVSLETFKLLFKMFKLGLTLKTVFQIVTQLVLEKFDSRYVARRPIFQTILFFDFFKKLYKVKNPPDFATFFTNHVASAQHRFWHVIFPESFPDNLKPKDFFHKKTVEFSLAVLDNILGYAMKLTEKNNQISVIMASSMGQDTVLRHQHQGFEAILKDVNSLLRKLGISTQDYQVLMAMAPQVTVELENPTHRTKVLEELPKFLDNEEKALFEVDVIGKSVTITMKTPAPSAKLAKVSYLKNQFAWKELGIEFLDVEPGTGYHIPEGVLYFYNSKIKDIKQIPLAHVKSELLKLVEL